MMDNSINVSIIISCYNSVNRIKPTLEHIANQKLDNLIYEVILVDNNCTDDTVAVAEKVWSECGNPFALHVIKEQQAGLSYARKAGVIAAKGEIIIFCDDDNWLDQDYCRIALDVMQSDSSIGVLGGRGIAVSDIEFPYWFSTYQALYAVGVQNINTGSIDHRGYVWGAGMVVRTKEIKRIYNSGFQTLLTDRVGNSLTSGGDSELCKWFLLVGKGLSYSEELVFKHYIELNRLNKKYLARLKNGLTESSKILSLYNLCINYLNGYQKLSFKKKLIMLVLYFIGKSTKINNAILECNNSCNYVFDMEVKSIKNAIQNFKSIN